MGAGGARPVVRANAVALIVEGERVAAAIGAADERDPAALCMAGERVADSLSAADEREAL